MIDAGELKKGFTIELDGQLYQVVDFQHIKMGRGSAQTRIKLKDIKAGRTVEKVFQSSEKFKRAVLEYHPIQYQYNDGDLYHFMDTETFDQIPLDKAQLGNAVNYMKEGIQLELATYKEVPIGVEMPIMVELKVVETDPGFKGDTATAGTKPAKLETGITINVPLFVNTGDTLKVDTRTGQYLERAS